MADTAGKLAKMIAPYFDDIDFLFHALDHACGQKTYDGRWPDLFGVQFLVRGALLVGRDGGPQTLLRAPALHWIEPRHTYQVRSADGHDAAHVVCCRGPRARRLLLEGFDRLSQAGWLPVPDPEGMDALFRLLVADIGRTGPARHAAAVLHLERVLAICLERMPAVVSAEPAWKAVDQAAERIRRNPAGTESLAELARRAHLSVSHFRRLFRARIGRPPHAYQLLCRMREAAVELQDPDRRIGEVAQRAGYDDPAAFSRVFRAQMGLSPRLYRRRQ